MKRKRCRTYEFFCFSILPIAVLALLVVDAGAYQRYKNSAGTAGSNCSACHGNFTDGTSPKGSVIPSNNKHTMHRSSSYMGAVCGLCHLGGDGRNPYLAASDGSSINVGIGCNGCHEATGLRAHHAAAGVTSCAMCHSGDPVPPKEGTKPAYYGTADTKANLPCNPVAQSNINENWTVGDFLGLDNDGDGLYDSADPDCSPAVPETNCFDGVDNDNDGLMDCLDSDCNGVSGPATACGRGVCASTGNLVCLVNMQSDTCTAGAPTEPNTELSCSDGLDNDCDGLIDAAQDPDCVPTAQEVCFNGLDDDGDMLVDCADTADCEGAIGPQTSCGEGVCYSTGNLVCGGGQQFNLCMPGSPTEPGKELTCDDAVDNDCDGKVDGVDSDCVVAVPETNCFDGLDNDSDGKTDCLDSDCAGVSGMATTCGVGVCASTGHLTCLAGAVVNTCTVGTPTQPGKETSCNDGLDNDCDGLIDTAQDPDCAPTGPVETSCFDGVDNDADRLIDCADPDCEGVGGGPFCNTERLGICDAGTWACKLGASKCVQTNPVELEGNSSDGKNDFTCSDLVDNDCDGLIDMNDTGCQVVLWPPVRQVLGIDDVKYENLVETDCRGCHNQNPPIPEVNPMYLPDRHHLKVSELIPAITSVLNPDSNVDGVKDTHYDCLNCHSVTWSGINWVLDPSFRNCLVCHLNTPHHTSVKAYSGNCAACHGDRVDRRLFDSNGDGYADTIDVAALPAYEPSLITPWPSQKPNGGYPVNSRGTLAGNCDYCHDSGTSPEGLTVLNNYQTHHNTGLPNVVVPGAGTTNLRVCAWCHEPDPPDGSKNKWSIRACENCHGIDSLHNIQSDSNGDGVINPGIELPTYGHIGVNDDCWGCHGFSSAQAIDIAPKSGPVIPDITGMSLSTIEAGLNWPLTITGNAFVNTILNPMTGQYDRRLDCDVVLTDAKGNETLLEPLSVTGKAIDVIIPATMPAGNYKVVARKVIKDSNPMNLSITPGAAIDHVTCGSEGYFLMGGKGFGSSHLDAEGSGMNVTQDVVVTTYDSKGRPITTTEKETATIVIWSENWILGRFRNCPEDGAVTVNTLFTSSQSSTGDGLGGGKGGGKAR